MWWVLFCRKSHSPIFLHSDGALRSSMQLRMRLRHFCFYNTNKQGRRVSVTQNGEAGGSFQEKQEDRRRSSRDKTWSLYLNRGCVAGEWDVWDRHTRQIQAPLTSFNAFTRIMSHSTERADRWGYSAAECSTQTHTHTQTPTHTHTHWEKTVTQLNVCKDEAQMYTLGTRSKK